MSSPGRANQDVKLDIEFDDNQAPLEGVYEIEDKETPAPEGEDTFSVKRILEENQKREKKIDVNYQCPHFGVTALHWAAEKGSMEIIEELLKVPGININEKNSTEKLNTRGETPLMRAIEFYKTDAIKRLLQAPGIDVNSQEKYGFTAMFIAIEWHNQEAMQILLEKKDELKLNMSIKDEKGKTAILFASYTRDWMEYNGLENDFVPLLLNSLDCVNEKDDENLTPLQIAVLKGYTSVVEQLLKVPEVDKRADKEGRTALHLAALHKMPEEKIGDKTKMEVELEENDTILKLMAVLEKGGYSMTVRDNKDYYASNYLSDHRSPELLKSYLDNCIEKGVNYRKEDFKEKKSYNYKKKKENRDSGDFNISISLNSFRPLDEGSVRESEPFQPFIDADTQNIHHPVILLYLTLKWIQMRKYYFINFAFYAIFVSILTSFKLCSFAGSANAELKYTLLVLTIMMTVRELTQMLTGFPEPTGADYFKSARNCLEILMIGSIYTLIFANLTWPSSQVNHMSAIVILLSWGELFMMIGRHPQLSIYIRMFLAVSKTFIKVIIMYSSLILAFTFCLYILLHKPEGSADDQPLYGSVPKGIFKILVMSFTGEAEYGNMVFNDDWEQIYFMIFIFFIMVVLINLLNGLAITDIGQLRTDSENETALRRYRTLLKMEDNMANFDKDWSVLHNRMKVFGKNILPDTPGKLSKENKVTFNTRMKVFGKNILPDTPWKLSKENKVTFNKPAGCLDRWLLFIFCEIPISIPTNARKVLEKNEEEEKKMSNKSTMSNSIERMIRSMKHK